MNVIAQSYLKHVSEEDARFLYFLIVCFHKKR